MKSKSEKGNRDLAEKIFRCALDAADPARLISEHVKIKDGILVAGSFSKSLDEIENIYVIGAGKASAVMAAEIEKIIGERITDGHIVVKYGHSSPLSRISLTEAAHPLPDQNGFKATVRISEIAEKASAGDLVICLLSGGGSALLADVPSNITQADLLVLNDILVRSGASISEINTVRKHLSEIKGGRLAAKVYPAMLVNLMLSDVPGDSPEVIASGPTYPDSSTFSDALKMIYGHDLQNVVPASILAYLLMGEQGLIAESPKPGDAVFINVHNILIGNNRSALDAAAGAARRYGFRTVLIRDDMRGDTNDFASAIVSAAKECRDDDTVEKPACLLFGGETTLKVTGKGLGGRNQHMALSCGIQLKGTTGITILAAGTDGTDGPTDAAGAVVDSHTCTSFSPDHISPEKYLEDFDSYNFFSRAGGHIKTGPTLTNVMDIVIVLIDR